MTRGVLEKMSLEMSNFGNSSAKVSVANKISNDTSVDINSAAIVYKGFGETIRALME